MGEKKKPGRFTLQFNLKDPQQRTVSELLEQQGRHKAQFITSAVLRYIQHPKAPERSIDPPAIEEETLEKMLISIIKKHPQLMTHARNEMPESKDSPVLTAPSSKPWSDTVENDAIKAITETLAAFQKA